MLPKTCVYQHEVDGMVYADGKLTVEFPSEVIARIEGVGGQQRWRQTNR